MILHPSVLALVFASLATGGLLLYAARWALVILSRWDLRSGSGLQLELERRTYLLSTMVACALAFEVGSLFLYVYTADSLSPLFTGAMCAAGTLKASTFGYPVLLLKLLNSILTALWLALHHLDAAGHDYPLIRPKYALLLGLTPLVLAEGALQVTYFSHLRPDVITSCCGSLFTRSRGGVAGALAGLPRLPTAAAFYATTLLAIASGSAFRLTRRGGYLLAASAAVAVPVGLASVIAFISPYVYELPTHHCPFCLLQREYGFVGYPLYGALLGGGCAGMAVGVVLPFSGRASLAEAAPAFSRRLAMASVALLSLLLAISSCAIFRSNLKP